MQVIPCMITEQQIFDFLPRSSFIMIYEALRATSKAHMNDCITNKAVQAESPFSNVSFAIILMLIFLMKNRGYARECSILWHMREKKSDVKNLIASGRTSQRSTSSIFVSSVDFATVKLILFDGCTTARRHLLIHLKIIRTRFGMINCSTLTNPPIILIIDVTMPTTLFLPTTV